ncbi:hypothetical protein [Patulibacter sp. SYSU D01012]|uniref:hypothetical protein n=1 Tax=Patulibacter sp. SYSU D01012 TaxID=2817381 RepID=UPI001B316D08|nr:hypothetical protein [Patulibacter sp. SYSU D01012]
MKTTPSSGDGQLVLPSSVTLTLDERGVLRSYLSGEFDACERIGMDRTVNDEPLGRLRLSLRVAEALGPEDADHSGDREIDDPIVIQRLHELVLNEIESGFQDDERDYIEEDWRAEHLVLERKLAVDRFGLAARYGVTLDDAGRPDPLRAPALAAERLLFFRCREAFEKHYPELADDLDARSGAAVRRLHDVLYAEGHKSPMGARFAGASAPSTALRAVA